MRAVFKPDEPSAVVFDEAAKIVRAALRSLTGNDPGDKVLALVLAKLTLEVGRKGTTLFISAHCSNFGNIKAGADYEGMFTLYKCNEVIDKQVEWFAPEGKLSGKGGEVVGPLYLVPPEGDGHPQCRFRAYANEVDGIYEYLDFIWGTKWRDARDALLTGDPHAYVHALKLKGYFTADETVYGKAVTSIHAEFVARLAGRPAPVILVPDLTGLIAAQPWNLQQVAGALAALDAAFADRRFQVIAENHQGNNFSDEEPDTAVLPKGQNQA